MRLVFGSSLAALVAVNELASQGKQVVWLKPKGRIAGHFFGTDFLGRAIDVGMVAVESFQTNSLPFDRNVPPVGATGLDYLNHAVEWWGRIGVPLEPLSVRTIVGCEAIPDYLIRDNLEFLSELSESETLQAKSELSEVMRTVARDDFMHPRNKRISEYFRTHNVQEVCLSLYGNLIFRKFFEPWISKFLASGIAVRAIDHRLIWVPLYYPETLLMAIESKTSKTSIERPFLYPKSGTIAGAVRMLVQNCSSNSLVECIDLDLTVSESLTRYLTDNQFTSKIFFGSQDQLAILRECLMSPHDPKDHDKRDVESRDEFIGLSVANFRIEAPSEQGVLNLVNSSSSVYRVSIRVHGDRPEESFATVELSGESESEKDKVSDALSVLERLGIQAMPESLSMINGRIPIPKFSSSPEQVDERVQLDLLGWGGKVIDRSNSSLNDQISLGLWGVEV